MDTDENGVEGRGRESDADRRLAGFSGAGRGEQIATGAMIEGDYIDSRKAAIRHDQPSCAADVTHDDLQSVAFGNKLAGFDSSGVTMGGMMQLLPHTPYDYHVPRAASPGFVLVKHVAHGNKFNGKKPARGVASGEASTTGALPLPPMDLRTSLAKPAPNTDVRSSAILPTRVQPLLAAHVAAGASVTSAATSRKRKATEW